MPNPDHELNVNYLVSCIESINNIHSLPPAEELKSNVNGWVDSKVEEAFANSALRQTIFSNWRRLSGDADSEKIIETINTLPDTPMGKDLRESLNNHINQQLEAAMSDPANKMLFFRSWLATCDEPVAAPAEAADTAEAHVESEAEETFIIETAAEVAIDEPAPAPSSGGSNPNWPW
jgi:hypothetical protein